MLREVLGELGLESYVKVSGSKGLQVYVPFNSPVTYEETQPFAKALAELLEQRQPQLVVSKMSKTLRKNKVFIDWSQNAESKTTVAVYSLRAKTHRPYVSLPVDWKELTAALKKNDANELFFTPEEALQRVEELGDLFKPVLKTVQKLPRELRQHPEHEPDRKVQLQNLPKARLEFIEPMLAMPVDRLPEKGDWFYELKFDGYRALAVKRRSEVRLFSRRGNTLNKRFRRIAEAFDFLPDDTIVDGEVVALDDTGKPSFSALQNSLRDNRSLYFYAFDLLAYQGKDVRKLPLSERRKVLEEYALAGMRDPVRLSAVFNTTPRELIAAAKQNGLEGVIAKRATSNYQSGERSGAWMKYRTNQGQEFVIGGYKPDPVAFEYLLAGYFEGKNLIFVGKIKNGLTPALRRKVAEHFKGLETDRCPFANLPEPPSARRGEALTAEVMKKIQWLRPKLVAQIEFTEWTTNNHLRHSRFVGLRDDKKPQEVTREFPQ